MFEMMTGVKLIKEFVNVYIPRKNQEKSINYVRRYDVKVKGFVLFIT